MTGTVGDLYAYLLHYTINIILFYLNAHLLLIYSIKKPRSAVIIFPLFIISEIAVFVAIKYLAVLIIMGEGPDLSADGAITKYVVSNIMRLIYIMGFSTAYWFALLTIHRSKKLAIMETEQLIKQNEKILLQKDLLQTRNAYLQAQVNPHLLFNTLNFMYNASAKLSDKLAQTVMSLSDIMRYALTAIDKDDKVELEKEISHIHNYFQLNQARFDEKLNISISINGDPEGLRIIPLALITLVENIFKYGDLHDPQNPAHISLDIHQGKLVMELQNKKRANRPIHGYGTGIHNLKERLDIYYPNDYSMEVIDKENNYKLRLEINLG